MLSLESLGALSTGVQHCHLGLFLRRPVCLSCNHKNSHHDNVRNTSPQQHKFRNVWNNLSFTYSFAWSNDEEVKKQKRIGKMASNTSWLPLLHPGLIPNYFTRKLTDIITITNKEILTFNIVKVKNGSLAFHIIVFSIVRRRPRWLRAGRSENWVAQMRLSTEQTSIGWYFEIYAYS